MRNRGNFGSSQDLTVDSNQPRNFWGFSDSSVGKESSCTAGDPSSIPGSGRSTAEGIGYPLQYSWASLVAQLVNNPPAMQDIWVWSLAWEDPLEISMCRVISVLLEESV